MNESTKGKLFFIAMLPFCLIFFIVVSAILCVIFLHHAIVDLSLRFNPKGRRAFWLWFWEESPTAFFFSRRTRDLNIEKWREE